MVEVNRARSIRMAVSASLAAASLLISGVGLAGSILGSDAIGGTGARKASRAIGGTGSTAIGGTGFTAIGGTGSTAIGGTGVAAIGGTGSTAIGGTGVAAIGGTGSTAIGGTGADAIGGTGRNKVSGAALVLKGPVEKVDSEAGTIVVLGRQLSVPVASKLMERIGTAMDAGNTVEIAISGQFDASGRLQRASAMVTEDQYIAGVSKVVVSGRISSFNSTTATAVVNGIVVGFSSALVGPVPNLSVGDVATFVGTLPQAGQQMLASTVVKRKK